MTLLPTLNRTKLLERFLRSAIDFETSTPGMIIVDEIDWDKNKDKYENIEKTCLPQYWQFVKTKSIKMGDKIREVWPQVKSTDASWVNILNDDHLIKTKFWDKKLVSKLDGTNFVTCNDGWMSPRKASGATMFSMPLLEAINVPIYLPGMLHLFIDDLWETIGRSTGCWDIDHSVLIEHHNQLKTPNERDQTFYAVYGKGPDLHNAELWKNDEKVYQNFIRNDFITTRNKIRKLRGQLEVKYNS